jgi:hypothetical protein
MGFFKASIGPVTDRMFALPEPRLAGRLRDKREAQLVDTALSSSRIVRAVSYAGMSLGSSRSGWTRHKVQDGSTSAA